MDFISILYITSCPILLDIQFGVSHLLCYQHIDRKSEIAMSYISEINKVLLIFIHLVRIYDL